MTRQSNRHTRLIVGLVVAITLHGCHSGYGGRLAEEARTMPTLLDTKVIAIEADHSVRLDNNLTVAGDERLSKALTEGTALDVVVLERMPPVYVVTYPGRETVRYPSRITR